MTARRSGAAGLLLAWVAVSAPVSVQAHAGPPFPIVSDQIAGSYQVSVWTDPDTTDDGTAAGQFWVMLEAADGTAVPAGTRVVVTIRPTGRPGPALSADAVPVNGDVSRQFAALLMDHEGRFEVQAAISGARGPATVRAEVEATYDERPPPVLLAVYVMPFILVGILWLKLLRRRKQ
jgi:hypothetical protein